MVADISKSALHHQTMYYAAFCSPPCLESDSFFFLSSRFSLLSSTELSICSKGLCCCQRRLIQLPMRDLWKVLMVQFRFPSSKLICCYVYILLHTTFWANTLPLFQEESCKKFKIRSRHFHRATRSSSVPAYVTNLLLLEWKRYDAI